MRLREEDRLGIDSRVLRSDSIPIEFLDHFCRRAGFGFFEQTEAVGCPSDDGFGGNARLPIDTEPSVTMAFCKTTIIHSTNQRNMSVGGRRLVERAIDLHLSEGAGDKIVPANHLRDFGRHVVNANGQLIGGLSGLLGDWKVTEFNGGIAGLLAEVLILKGQRFIARAKSPAERDFRDGGAVMPVAAGTGIDRSFSSEPAFVRRGQSLLDVFARTRTGVNAVCPDECLQRFGIGLGALCLVGHFAIPAKAQPAEVLDGLFRGP